MRSHCLFAYTFFRKLQYHRSSQLGPANRTKGCQQGGRNKSIAKSAGPCSQIRRASFISRGFSFWGGPRSVGAALPKLCPNFHAASPYGSCSPAHHAESRHFSGSGVQVASTDSAGQSGRCRPIHLAFTVSRVSTHSGQLPPQIIKSGLSSSLPLGHGKSFPLLSGKRRRPIQISSASLRAGLRRILPGFGA